MPLTPSIFKNKPIVLFGESEKEGTMFVGQLRDKRAAGKGQVYEFLLESCTAPIGLATGKKDAKGQNIYDPVSVDAGAEVVIFSDTELSDYIGLQTPLNQRVQIKFLGWVKNSDKSKSPRKHYEVEHL
jgi:hypothetical protein